MNRLVRQACLGLALCCQVAGAQEVIEGNEFLSADRPEAWAMNYAAASTYLSSFGPGRGLLPGQWQVAGELGAIPRLDASQRQVGFNGYKTEDLNKSPAFGRVRLLVGLPYSFVAELGYTPPVRINGASAHRLASVALGRHLWAREGWSLSSRVFGQHGSVKGDITCPASIAGNSDPELNPFVCRAASRDVAGLNYYGVDATLGLERGRWRAHAGAGWVRTELEVQVDALTGTFRDRTRLVAHGRRHFMAVGLGRRISPNWSLAAEIIHVPLSVLRDPVRGRESDPLTSVRLMLAYQRE